jgi:hypothetical protein
LQPTCLADRFLALQQARGFAGSLIELGRSGVQAALLALATLRRLFDAIDSSQLPRRSLNICTLALAPPNPCQCEQATDCMVAM